jgi:hypothetical protein
MISFSFLLIVLCSPVFGNTESSSVLFQERGDVYVAYDVIHLVIPIDLGPLEQQCHYFRTTIQAALPIYKEIPQLENMWFSAAHLIKQSCDLQPIHTQVLQPMVKRQAMLGLGAVVGTIFGIYSLVRIQELGRRVHSLEQSHVDDLHILRNHETRMHLVERDVKVINASLDSLGRTLERQSSLVGKMLWMTTLTEQFGLLQLHLRAASDGFAALLSQRFPVSWVLPKELPSIYRAVEKRAQRMGGVLPLQQDVDLYHLPASFLVKDQTVQVFIHVPVVHERMKLYKYLDTPVKRNGTGYAIVRSERFDHLIVAERNRVHKEVDLTTLDRACVKMGQTLLCEHLGNLAKQMTQSCLGSLFINRDVQTHCVVRDLKDPWLTAQLDHDLFQIFVRDKTTLFTECVNGSRTTSELIGIQVIRIPRWCWAYTNEFELRSSSSSTMSVTISNRVVWNHQALETALYREVIPSVHLEVGNDLESKLALAREEERARLQHSQHSMLWMGGGMALTLFLLLGVLVLYLAYRFRQLGPVIQAQG